MSGDVQPRKRKDKRRKKADGEYTIQWIHEASIDDEDTGTPPPTLISPPDIPAENVAIHVYKESSTGGHWCARIVFFVLLAVLVGLIGIIIFEHRGTTDVDTPVASSRWASIFEGWVDDSTSSHADEPHDQEETVEESEEALEEEEEKGDRDEEESAEAEKEEEEESLEEDEGIGEEEEEEEEEEETEEEERAEAEEEGTEEDNDVESKEDQEEDEGIDEGEIDEETNDDSQQEFDIPGILEEIDDTNENENTDEEDDTPDDFDMELDTSTDITDDSPEEKDNDVSEEFTGIPGVNDIDDNSAEPLEEIEGEESEEDVNDGDSESEEEEIEEESTSVPVKFGVGIALVVAAHFVLVRRWNNADIDSSHLLHDITDVADLTRRNTIVPPPHVKQVIKSAENIENKVRAQVEAYEDLKSKYNKLQEENVSLSDLENLIPKEKDKRSTRNTAKEEITTNGGQSKVISSEEEDEEEDYEGDELETSEGERVSGAEEYEEEQAEEEEEEEEEDEEDEENVDDTELIAKLEAKYGKLPTPQDSEAEEEEVEEESEEEEGEGVDDELPEWKRVKAPKDSRVESQPRRPMQQTGMKTKHGDTSQAKSGGRTYDFSNVSDIDDIIIYEENDSAIPQVGKEFLD